MFGRTLNFSWHKIFLEPKILEPKFSQDLNFFGTKKFSGPKIIFRSLFLLKPKFLKTQIFGDWNFFQTKNYHPKNFVVHKFCSGPKLFRDQNFLGLNFFRDKKREPWVNFIILRAASATSSADQLIRVCIPIGYYNSMHTLLANQTPNQILI